MPSLRRTPAGQNNLALLDILVFIFVRYHLTPEKINGNNGRRFPGIINGDTPANHGMGRVTRFGSNAFWFAPVTRQARRPRRGPLDTFVSLK